MGQQDNRRVINLTEGDRSFLISKIFDITDRFDLLNGMRHDDQFEIIAMFAEEMIHNLILKINKKNVHTISS
jgi:hypothetical protein